MKLMTLAIRMFLGCLLLYGGLGEIRQPFDFLAAVHGYQLTGPRSEMVVAGLLPWLDVVVGTCLIAGLFTQGAFLSGVLLTGVFCFAICSAWWRGLSIHCGCFGSSGGDLITTGTVMRSLALLGLAVTGTATAFWTNGMSLRWFLKYLAVGLDAKKTNFLSPNPLPPPSVLLEQPRSESFTSRLTDELHWEIDARPCR